MKSNYEFSPLNQLYPMIQVENIVEFIISNKFYEINNFKSLEDANVFLLQNKNNLTYIKYKDDLSIILNKNDDYTTMYIKNGNYHRLTGAALIETDNKNNKREFFFIEGHYIDKEDYKKHPEVRAQKLKRIVKE